MDEMDYLTNDFFSSEAGQFSVIAKQFLEGALTLDVERRKHNKSRMLFRPTLALAGHGLELMLKACVYLNGKEPTIKGRKGHDVLRLWNSDICEPVRRHVFANAILVSEEDRTSGIYHDVPEQNEIESIIAEYVVELGKLHGKAPYQLRYYASTNQTAPNSPLLVRSLWKTSDDFVKRPNEFMLLNCSD
jgi:hypothetical protein